jgi:hypothetical protein
MSSQRFRLAPDLGQRRAAHRVGEITGATPAAVAVSRHRSLLLAPVVAVGVAPVSRWRGIYVFANVFTDFPYMNIKPQPKIEMATLSINGVEKRLVDGFRQRCQELNDSAQGFIMNQVLEEFLRSTSREPKESDAPRRKARVG